MVEHVDRDTWANVLEAIGGEPPVVEVADRLADAIAIAEPDAYDAVVDAIDDGILEETDKGAFGGVRLADSAEYAEEKAEDADIPDANPGCGADKTDRDKGERPSIDSWGEADFSTPQPDTFPPELDGVCQWMGKLEGEKMPFAPWGDRDHPDGDPEKDARFKWGIADNYTDGETVAMAQDDPRLDGRLFIQLEDDPYAFVDGDDVRCPETGEVHPAFIAILEHLGLTYADISTSGAGVHAYYRGELPIDGKGQATFDIDTEPWGANDSPPAIEIYANKHVNVTTGDHVAGTGTRVSEWNTDALRAILEANGYSDKPDVDHDTDRDRAELEEYEPDAVGAEQTTGEIRDVLKAVDRLKPSDVRLKTTRTGSDPTGWSTWNPAYRSSESGSSLHYNGEGVFHDHKEGEAFGILGLLAAEERIITDPWDPLTGNDWWAAVEAAREDGAPIPEYDPKEAAETSDPRTLEATVDPRRAWDAAGRVTPADVDSDQLEPATADSERFACPETGAPVDVVRGVAVDTGLIEPDEALEGEAYPEAYRRAREEYGAPLPEYYTTADAIAKFDAVLDVIGEVTFWHFAPDTLESEITKEGDEIEGEAVRALNPSWRESESEASVLVFESGVIWDASTERVVDALRFAALDSGLIDDPADPLEGETFTTAYRRCRRVYGAPLPRWEPAVDGTREITPQLPSSDEIVNGSDLSGVDPDALETAREDVEDLLADATADGDTPTVVTALPATGKTTATVKTAADRPVSYLAPRKELQAQALTKADRWGVDAMVLPVFAENRVRSDVLGAAVSHVRENGKQRLRDRWTILSAAFDQLDAEEDADTPELGDIFKEKEEDAEDVDLERPTCETAEGKHGVAWALAVHVARELGYTPREIHTQAVGLFGAELPCSADGCECEYTHGWNAVSDPDHPPDLLVGSYIHGHVESVRTKYERKPSDTVVKSPRAVVIDEFPGEAFVREFGEEAFDFATWLARQLREDVDDRRDMYDADLFGDGWVRAWLDGDATDTDAVGDAIDSFARTGELLDARNEAAEILEAIEPKLLEKLGFEEPLRTVLDGESTAAFAEIRDATADMNPEHPAGGIIRWVEDEVRDPLANATLEGATDPTVDGIDTDALPIDADLAALVRRAVEGVRNGEDGAPETIDAAVTALQGGTEGCRVLAAWADAGYAHPDAHHFLTGIITPTEADVDTPGAKRIQTDKWAFDPDATDGTVLDVVETTDRARTVIDRNDHGALLHTPPLRTAGNGDNAPLVGLDATGRRELWANAIGENVETADIHGTAAERAEFLETALSLRVVQAADTPRPYEGDPKTKDTDGDVALIEAIAEEYSGIDAPRKRGEEAAPVGKPAVITTKGVRGVLEDDPRLDDIVAAWENYGNVTGANDLGHHRLAAILGCQHYGDHAIERFCAIGGREIDTSRENGRGSALEYGDELADAYLKHMEEDQTMQAILRFSRGDSGATVIARTSALREDLPVIGRGQVVETWNDTATAIAREWRRIGTEFTAADVRDVVDVRPRHVRRVLDELADADYIRHVRGGNGTAKVYEPVDQPGAGEVELPERGDAVEPGRVATNKSYTWNVRVFGGERPPSTPRAAIKAAKRRAPPSPTAADGVEPPD